ncbi:MAG: hypothetical protein WCY88_11215 [Spongiibacteraceae bacterium]
MSVQEIAVSNRQRKKLLKAVPDESVLIQEENGDLVVSVAAYQTFKQKLTPAPIEAIIGDDTLDFTAEYFVFS